MLQTILCYCATFIIIFIQTRHSIIIVVIIEIQTDLASPFIRKHFFKAQFIGHLV